MINVALSADQAANRWATLGTKTWSALSLLSPKLPLTPFSSEEDFADAERLQFVLDASRRALPGR
jgi:hypothetical protein